MRYCIDSWSRKSVWAGLPQRYGARLPRAALIAKYDTLSAYQIAQVHAYRGESDKSFEWLERAYKQRDTVTEHRSAVQQFAPRPEIHRALEENAPADIEQSVAAPGMLCTASMEVSAAELVGGKPVW